MPLIAVAFSFIAFLGIGVITPASTTPVNHPPFHFEDK